MYYKQFCTIVTKISSKIEVVGNYIDNQLIGNIHPFLPEYKSWGINEIEKFKKNISKNPTEFLKNFVADFSFVYFSEDNKIIAARDHFGIFPLYYYNDENQLIISNDQRLITSLPNLDLTPDSDWMGDYVTQSNAHTCLTFYKNIKKLLPAHLLEYRDGVININKYWELNLSNPLPKKTDEEYIEEFKQLLQQAVESRIPEEGNVGSEVSGGIDCTSIAAIAKSYLDKQNRPLYTYAHAAVDAENNDSEKVPITKFVEFLKPYKHTFIPDKIKGMRHVVEHAIKLGNGISQSHYAMFSKEIYEKAQADDVKIIFSGNGGDHGVSYKGSFAIIGAHISDGRYNKALKELKIINNSRIRTIYSFIKNFIFIKFNIGSNKVLNKEKDKSKVDFIYEFTKAYPILKEYKYKPTFNSSKFKYSNHIIADKLLNSDISKRGESTTIAASNFGVIYRYPLLDIRLLQYFMSLPPHMLYQDGVNRYIFRKTIENWVPKTVAYQPKPPANMYGWIMEAYKYDFENKLEYNLVPENEEMKFCLDYWKIRDEGTYKGEKLRKTITL